MNQKILPPSKIEKGGRVINIYGRIETIYGIEDDIIGKYISTIATDDVSSPTLKTYLIKENKDNMELEKVAEKKVNILKNLEKTTLDQIEKEMGSKLASQSN